MIRAFLQLISSPYVHESLADSAGLHEALQSTLLHLRGVAVNDPADIDVALVEAMLVVLEGMTSTAWPDKMFSWDSGLQDLDETPDAHRAT